MFHPFHFLRYWNDQSLWTIAYPFLNFRETSFYILHLFLKIHQFLLFNLLKLGLFYFKIFLFSFLAHLLKLHKLPFLLYFFNIIVLINKLTFLFEILHLMFVMIELELIEFFCQLCKFSMHLFLSYNTWSLHKWRWLLFGW